MASHKKITPATPKIAPSAPALTPKPSPVAPVARSETKGSGTIAAAKPMGSIAAKPNPTYEQIAERAHQIYLKRGFGPGDATSDWLEAERQLKAGR